MDEGDVNIRMMLIILSAATKARHPRRMQAAIWQIFVWRSYGASGTFR